MEEGGWSLSGLAKRVGRDENRQTLHHLTKGEALVKCRQSRRKKIARLVEVPEGWLAGETELELPRTGVAHLERFWRRSPRLALATWRLMDRCYGACKRDLTRYRAEPDQGEPWSATQEVLFFVAWAIGEFSMAARWQHTLLKDRRSTRPASPEEIEWDRDEKPGLDSIRRISVEEEAGSIAIVRAFDFILQPWFEDTHGLRYDRFADLAAAVSPVARAFPPTSDKPMAIIAKDGRKLRPIEPETPYALLRWPENQSKKGGRNG
jgi:hypothetical protein